VGWRGASHVFFVVNDGYTRRPDVSDATSIGRHFMGLIERRRGVRCVGTPEDFLLGMWAATDDTTYPMRGENCGSPWVIWDGVEASGASVDSASFFIFSHGQSFGYLLHPSRTTPMGIPMGIPSLHPKVSMVCLE